MNGVIKKYFEDKGFGFIKSETGEDYFFHASQFQDNENPSIGAVVYFDENQNEKGKCAYLSGDIILISPGLSPIVPRQIGGRPFGLL